MAKEKFNYLVEVYGSSDHWTFRDRSSAYNFCLGIATMGGLFSWYRRYYKGLHVGEKDTVTYYDGAEWVLILENESENPVLPVSEKR